MNSKSKSQVKKPAGLKQADLNMLGTKSDVFTPLREKSPEAIKEIIKKFQLPEEVKSRSHSRGISNDKRDSVKNS